MPESFQVDQTLEPAPRQAPVDVDPKAGFKTSEYWGNLVAKVFALLATMGVITQADASTYTVGFKGIVAGVFTVCVCFLARDYTKSRTLLKKCFLFTILGAFLATPVQAQVAYTDVHYFGFFRQYHQKDPAPAPAGPQQADPNLIAALQRIADQLAAQKQAAPTPAPQPIIVPIPYGGNGPGQPQVQIPAPGQPQIQIPAPGQPKIVIGAPGQPQIQIQQPGQPQIQIHSPGQPAIPIGAPTPAPAAPPGTPVPTPIPAPTPSPGVSADPGPAMGMQTYSSVPRKPVLNTWRPK